MGNGVPVALDDQPGGLPGTTPTVASYLAMFGVHLDRRAQLTWPADVFAVTNLVLDHSEAYRYAVSPPPGRRWPPTTSWSDEVVTAAGEWRRAVCRGAHALPPRVRHAWDVLVENLDQPLGGLRRGTEPELCEALLTLHATADEVHRVATTDEERTFKAAARSLLARSGSLSRIDPTRIRVLPKTQLTTRGITIRSFSRYVALTYESIDLDWTMVEVGDGSWVEGREYHMMLVPWPFLVDANAFRPVEAPVDMDPDVFGFFSYEPSRPLTPTFLSSLIGGAREAGSARIDAVVLPESAIDREEIGPLEDLLAERGVGCLVAGVHQTATAGRMARNYVHLGFLTKQGWLHFEQDKHHRWCLDPSQIRAYHLTRALPATRHWWEAIELPTRAVRIIDTGDGATMAPLICEDLARLDEVADMLRRIGPSFVMGLLLDGPQLAQRWACRYAAMLADDPGSAVLTISSLGMVARSRPEGSPSSRAVAMWSDPISGSIRLELARGARAIVTRSTVTPAPAWTADGRQHPTGIPSSVLSGVTQVWPAPRPRGRPA